MTATSGGLAASSTRRRWSAVNLPSAHHSKDSYVDAARLVVPARSEFERLILSTDRRYSARSRQISSTQAASELSRAIRGSLFRSREPGQGPCWDTWSGTARQ